MAVKAVLRVAAVVVLRVAAVVVRVGVLAALEAPASVTTGASVFRC